MFTHFGLHERLLKALEKLGLSTPTPVQEAVIPAVLAGHDIQASAETGSGKTAAFLLPVLHRLLTVPAPDTATRCLILLPTRELAAQIHRQFRDLATFTSIRAELILGGKGLREQQAAIRKNPEILIGTPGRLREHVERGSAELGDLEVLVLDEADRMLDMGLRDEVMAVVRACRHERQTLLLSATLQHGGIGRIAEEVLREPQVIALGSPRERHARIHQQIVLADDKGHKQQLLTWLLAHQNYRKALVFANTRADVEALAEYLGHYRTNAAPLHGEMTQEEREREMRRFREGGARVLVSTDLAARGLDVEGVDLVINFAMARSGDDHVHRVGRTGRAGEQGVAVSLVAPQEWNRMCAIERYLGLDFERRTVEELPARFQGPSGKAKKGKKTDRKKTAGGHGKDAKPKAKQRHRDRKNIGKRRRPSDQRPGGEGKVERPETGHAPLTRKRK